MHAAPLSSPRLRRVLAVLRDGRSHTTRAIVRQARVMAVSACVAELRQHGADITCTVRLIKGQRRFYYRMLKEPKNA